MIDSRFSPESFSDIFGEYLTIEDALRFFIMGLQGLSEKPDITSGDIQDCSGAMTVILQKVRIINDSLDIKIRNI